MEQGKLEELLEMFYRCAHLLHRSGPHFRRHGKRPPMPPAQDRLMRLLMAAKGPVTQRDLSEILDIRSASLSELLSKLEKPGWISRRPNDTDKRTIDVNLTEEGENMLRNIGNERADMAGEVFGSLTEEELRQLYSLLGKLIGDWETRFESEGHHGRRGRRVGGEGRPDHGPGWFRRVGDHFHHHHGPHDHHHFDGQDEDGRDCRSPGRRHDHPAHYDRASQRASAADFERASEHSKSMSEAGTEIAVRPERDRFDAD